MTADTSYNGWANYETWAVGMFLDGNYTGEGTYAYVVELVTEWRKDGRERWSIADGLESFVRDETDPCGYGNDDAPELHPLVSDLFGAALSRVDWYELADAWIENVSESGVTS